MKRGLKKKGSSLVAVLVICSIILVVASTMIGVATSNVRMRMNESKKLQNLYKADSGLEVVNNIILKDSEAAIVYAQQEMQNSGLVGGTISNTSDDEVYDSLNTEFQALFIKALLKSSVNGITVESDKNQTRNNVEQDIKPVYDQEGENVINNENGEPITDTTVKSRLLYGLKNGFYVSSINTESLNTTFVDAFYGIDQANKPNLKILSATYNDSTRTIKLTIRSSFSCAETSTTKLPNKKVIETTFKITAPEYADIISRSNSTDELVIQAPYSNVLTVDGNLNVNSDLTLAGNAWVKGDADTAASENQSIVFSKYNGGIKLASGKDFTTNSVGEHYPGNIYTAGTFSLVNSSNVNLSGNLYSGNTYIGPSSTNDSSSRDNTMSLGDMITYNDLGINSLSSTITMNNYYGINGETTDSNNGGKNNASKRSSCIIINNYNTVRSALNISNDAYIAGVAYINTGNENSDNGEYETGESIAVRGNYKAYQEALTKIGENKITPGFEYYNPTKLLETINGEKATVQDKRDYFNEYYRNNVFKDGNVTIGGHVYSTGAIVTTDKKNAEELDAQDLNVKNARRAYALNVLSMNSNLNDSQLDTVYNNGTVTKTVKGSDTTTAVVNFGTMNPGVEVHQSNPQRGLVNALNNCAYVLGNDENSTIVISPGRISVDGHTEPVDSSTICPQCFNFNQENGEDIVNAVIITNGNVKIEDGVKFKGCIIAGGNVEVAEGASGVNLSYNASVVGQIITVNGLNTYFNVPMNEVERLTVNDGDIISINPTETNSYNVDGIVNTGFWKLIENKDDR